MGVHTHYSRGTVANEQVAFNLLMSDVKTIFSSPLGREDANLLDYTFGDDYFLLNGKGAEACESFEWSVHYSSDYFKVREGLYELYSFAIMMRAVRYYPYVNFGSEGGINLTYADEIYESAFREKFSLKCRKCGSERTAQDFKRYSGFTSECECATKEEQ